MKKLNFNLNILNILFWDKTTKQINKEKETKRQNTSNPTKLLVGRASVLGTECLLCTPVDTRDYNFHFTINHRNGISKEKKRCEVVGATRLATQTCRVRNRNPKPNPKRCVASPAGRSTGPGTRAHARSVTRRRARRRRS